MKERGEEKRRERIVIVMMTFHLVLNRIFEKRLYITLGLDSDILRGGGRLDITTLQIHQY